MGNIPGMSLLTGGMGSKANPAPVGAESWKVVYFEK
jgi:hypothetical protein